MFSHNFWPFIEAPEPRATQINELGIALAGTAGHELAHAYGLRHHDAYGDPKVELNQFGFYESNNVQNTHVMATGSTGLTEEEREVLRTFGQWENVILEAAAGLTASPLALAHDETAAGVDVPGTTLSAQSVPLTGLPISQTQAAVVHGRTGVPGDLDVYSFSGTAGELVTASVSSIGQFDDFIDTHLRLFDTDGSTILATNDNVSYTDDFFGFGGPRVFDAFLLNIELPHDGTYFLEIGPSISSPAEVGDYDLIFATSSVPEPTSFMLAFVAAVVCFTTARRSPPAGAKLEWRAAVEASSSIRLRGESKRTSRFALLIALGSNTAVRCLSSYESSAACAARTCSSSSIASGRLASNSMTDSKIDSASLQRFCSTHNRANPKWQSNCRGSRSRPARNARSASGMCPKMTKVSPTRADGRPSVGRARPAAASYSASASLCCPPARNKSPRARPFASRHAD